MKTYKVTYTLEATVPIEADSPEHARWRFQEYTVDQLTSFAADSLKVVEVTEEGKEREGLSSLKPDMMHRSSW